MMRLNDAIVRQILGKSVLHPTPTPNAHKHKHTHTRTYTHTQIHIQTHSYTNKEKYKKNAIAFVHASNKFLLAF